jgi:Uma2 family endonuclease
MTAPFVLDYGREEPSMIAMPQEQKGHSTIEDLENLPENVWAELIDGQIYYFAAPSPRHQEIVSALNANIYNFIKSKGRNCKVYPAPFAVFLNKDDKTELHPDLSVVCDLSKIDAKGCNGAPDWIIEIVSPSSIAQDNWIKLNRYKAAGVKEYWIVNPLSDDILVYDLEASSFANYTFTDIVPVGIFEGFSIDFNQLAIE